MIRIIIIATALSLAALFKADTIDAQQRWGIELRGSGAISTQDAAKDTHEKGFGVEASVQYRFLPHLAAYAATHHTRFSALEAIAGPRMEMEETGYALGLRFERPLREGGGTTGWLRTGATFNHLEIEESDGDLVDESGYGLGWEFGAGVAVPFRSWSVTPGVRYRSISRDLEIDDVTIPVELQSIALEIGFRRSF